MSLTIFENQSDFEIYGLWNRIAAFDKDNKLIDLIPAHDGDFFPESPLDYIETLRNANIKEYINNNSLINLFSKIWPVRVDIDIAQNCSSNCYFCYSKLYSSDFNYKNAFIDKKVFEALVMELKEGGTKTIRFTGGGEPLIHKDIEKLLTIPRKNNLLSCLITNGDLLNAKISNLIANNIDHLRISLNATSTKVRNSIYRSSKYQDSINNIYKNLDVIINLRENKWHRQRCPSIWGTFLILPENHKEIYLAAKTMKDIGVDSISFRPVYHGLEHPFTTSQLNSIDDQLNKAKELHKPPEFLVYTPKREFTKVWELSPKDHFDKCISNRLRTVLEVTNNGISVKICGLHRGSHGTVLATIQSNNKFHDFWLSKNLINQNYEIPKNCAKCIDVSMNVTLNKILEVLTKNPKAIFKKCFFSE